MDLIKPRKCQIAKFVFFVLLFLQSSYLYADKVAEGIQLRLKEQILTETVSSLELRDGGMCFFLPQGKDFLAKVAINCSRLFDTMLDELYSSSETSIFGDKVVRRISNPTDRRRLLEIFQGDLSILSEFRIKNNNLNSEELSPVILEMAKLGSILLRETLGGDEQLKSQFMDIIRRFSVEVIEVLTEYRMEENVSAFGTILWSKLQHQDLILDMNLTLASLYGSREDVLNNALLIYVKDKNLLFDSLNKLLSSGELLSENSRNAIFNLQTFLKNCINTELTNINTSCKQLADQVGAGFKGEFNKNFVDSVRKYLYSNPSLSLIDLRNVMSKGFEDNEDYEELLNGEIRSRLLNQEFESEANLKLACELLRREPCELSLKSEFKILNISLIASGFIAFFMAGFFIFYKKKGVKNINNPKLGAGDYQPNTDELTTEERAELRNLRQFFELRPIDNLTELHQSYRKMVFQVHPDKLNDGGKEFILLQSRYLKTKELLERLEKSRKLTRANS